MHKVLEGQMGAGYESFLCICVCIGGCLLSGSYQVLKTEIEIGSIHMVPPRVVNLFKASSVANQG